jgi:hypothetical protein
VNPERAGFLSLLECHVQGAVHNGEFVHAILNCASGSD